MMPVAASGSVLLNVPIVKQDMNLDCESAALAAAMQYQGIAITQNQVFNQLPVDLQPAVVVDGQLVHWGDPYTAFVGNVNGSEEAYTGYGVYYPQIAQVASGRGLTTTAGGGWSWASLLSQLEAGNPVVVWVPWHLLPVYVTSYTAFDGRSVWFSNQEHAQVLIGYNATNDTITLMDPWDGDDQTYTQSLFVARFDAFQAQAVGVGPLQPCPHLGVAQAGDLSAAVPADCAIVDLPRPPAGSAGPSPLLPAGGTVAASAEVSTPVSPSQLGSHTPADTGTPAAATPSPSPSTPAPIPAPTVPAPAATGVAAAVGTSSGTAGATPAPSLPSAAPTSPTGPEPRLLIAG
jgi:uncharacterized protein YvpB